jgi:hypothetical protein
VRIGADPDQTFGEQTVQTQHYLFDHRGQRVPVSYDEAEAALAHSRSKLGDLDFAVRQAGWVEVWHDESHASAKLRFRCLSLCDEAATSAGALLMEAPLQDVSLQYHLCGEQWERFDNGVTAAARLFRLWQFGNALLRPPGLICSAKDPEELHLEKDNAIRGLALLLDLWHRKDGIFDKDVIPFLRRRNLLDRTLLIEPSAETDCPVFTFIGDGFTLYGEDWPKTGVGHPVNDQPDPAYGQWVVKSTAVIMASGLPQFEEISAQIRTPQGWSRRSRYKCLRLLWQTPAGHPIVMTVSRLTPEVDAPLFA